MRDDVAIRIKNVSKVYKVYQSDHERLKGLLFQKDAGKDFVALNHLSLEIKRGESYAIIGRNGSGKSTLLQLLAGIIEPTSGTIEINGKIAALLELGSGFNPDDSGYENIYMNAAILGISKKETEERIKDIIEFADIGEHLYQPVKTYSSGMFVRLAFAVAINVKADILLIDEALAVGDIFFRQKCYAKLDELKKQGVTIILVTHNMIEVEQFCNYGVLLRKGNVVLEGTSQAIVKEYYMLEQEGKKEGEYVKKEIKTVRKDTEDRGEIVFEDGLVVHPPKVNNDQFANISENGGASILWCKLYDEYGNECTCFQQGQKAIFISEVIIKRKIEVPINSIIIKNQNNIIVHGKDTIQNGIQLPLSMEAGSDFFYRYDVSLDIAEGEYTYEVGVGAIPTNVYKNVNAVSQIELDSSMERLAMVGSREVFTVNHLIKGNPTQMLFHGMADLPGKAELLIK